MITTYTEDQIKAGLPKKELEEFTKESMRRQNMADNVNHPKHYERENAIECIDEMVMIFGKTAVADFCKCNAWKYRYRAADKNGAEDIAKSDWYMRKYKELTEATERNNNRCFGYTE